MAIGCLFLKRQMMAWTRVAAALFFGLLYAVCAYVVREPRDLFPYQAAVVLLFYAFPAGLCMRRLSEDRHENAVAWAFVCFSIAMAGVAMIILQTAGPTRIVSEASVGAEMSRSNAASEMNAVYYLRYFSISNIIIGIIPFTVFGLSTFPIFLTARMYTLRMGVLCAIALAAYVNIQVATRTTLAACALSSLIIIPLVLRAVSFRRRLLFAVISAATMIAGYIYVTRNKDIFQFLGNRFSDVAQDSRLTIWRESLRILADTPDGAGIRRLSSHVWAHNLFLDVGLANGWIALGAILALCGVGFFLTWRSSREPDFAKSSANIIMLGWLISGFLALMVMPPLLPLLAMLYIGLAYLAPYRPG